MMWGEKRDEQRFLGGEVAVQGRAADICLLGNCIHRDVHASGAERLTGDFENMRAILLGIFPPRSSDRRRCQKVLLDKRGLSPYLKI